MKLRRKGILFMLMLFAVLRQGCSVYSVNNARRLVSEEYFFRKNLMLYGVRPESYPEKRIDYYLIFEMPGYSSRFVVSKMMIEPGDRFKIVSVELTNIYNGGFTAYIELNGDKFNNLDPRVRVHLPSGFFSKNPDGDWILDEDLFGKSR